MKNLKQTRKSILFLRYTKMTIFVLILIIANTSCSTSSDEEDDEGNGDGYMISFKANGTLEVFNADHFPRATFTDNGTYYIASFTALRSASSIQIQAHDNQAIIEKEYSGYFVKQATQTPAYVIGASISFQQLQVSHASPYDNPDVKVKIEKMTTTSVRGKFSGTLKSNGKPDIVITQGEFYVPLNKI